VIQVNLRKQIYFALLSLRGQPLGACYNRFVREAQQGIPADTTRQALTRLLAHCRQSVPYYAEVMRDLGDSFYDDPEEYLQQMPVLSRDTLRSRFADLKSSDLPRRRWRVDGTSGSTGEAAQFIQDREFDTQAIALTLLYSRLVGRDVGESEIYLWGSMPDILHGSEGWRARLRNLLTNSTLLNTFRMDSGQMRRYIALLNDRRPKLIISYADAVYELAKLAEREGLAVAPQAAIMTSAGTLYPFMRETIERVFQCKVYNRYGSREMGNIACERPGFEGLWVAPWANYVEIVDGEGRRVPDGEEGEILVTSLINRAMPLVRYRIGDRGVLAPTKDHSRTGEQVLQAVLGRTSDVLRTADGALVNATYFMYLLFHRTWVARFQVVQRDLSSIVFRIVSVGPNHPQAELDEITALTKRVMGDGCRVSFEFVDEITPTASGKYRYIICEVSG